MFDELRRFEPQFGLTAEDLEKAERKVPVYAIMNTLTSEQIAIVHDDMIKYSLLTSTQQTIVDEALAFDAALASTCSASSSRIHRII